MNATAVITPATTAGIVISTGIAAGSREHQHAEGIVVSTAITAGWSGLITGNHAEGILVTTAISAGRGGGGDILTGNHAEGVVAV